MCFNDKLEHSLRIHPECVSGRDSAYLERELTFEEVFLTSVFRLVVRMEVIAGCVSVIVMVYRG